MKICTFFGHRDCPSTIQPRLQDVLEDLITNHDVNTFYVGHQGQFDSIVYHTLQELKKTYPHIHVTVVLAYMPGKKTEYNDHSDTMLPEGIESVHPHYAISWRNNWMLKQSDYVVTYITRTYGGAAQYAGKAKSARKRIIELGNERTEQL